MSTTDKVVKSFGLRECILHDGLYLNPHTLARVIHMFSYNKQLYIILDGGTRPSEVADKRRPRYTACRFNCGYLHWAIWTILCARVSCESFKWILSRWEPLNRKRHLAKSMSLYHDELIKISVLLLRQPESCQFG